MRRCFLLWLLNLIIFMKKRIMKAGGGRHHAVYHVDICMHSMSAMMTFIVIILLRLNIK